MQTVLVTVDAARADHLGQYGYGRDTMPVVDRLADGGVCYERAYANGTNTGVSLPSLLSSRYRGASALRSTTDLASTLTSGDVATAGFHSNALFANRVGTPTGFDHYEDFDVAAAEEEENRSSAVERAYSSVVDVLRPIVERLGVRSRAESVQQFLLPASLVHEFSVYEDAADVTDAALAWAREHADEDFFLWVHYMDPHRPYGIADVDPAFGDPAEESEIRSLMSKAGLRPDAVTDAERQRVIDLYDSDLRYTSDQIDRLLDGFDAAGVEDPGIVLTADHGEEFGEHGEFFHRNRPYDELLHVPLVVSPPSTESPDEAVVEAPRELLDVAPQILEWHGIERPEQFQGRPLDEAGERRVVATGSFVETNQVVAGRWDGWKFIQVASGKTELYDLEADPGETDDLASDRTDVVEEFEDAIPAELYEGDPVTVDAGGDEAVQRRLSELGYLE